MVSWAIKNFQLSKGKCISAIVHFFPESSQINLDLQKCEKREQSLYFLEETSEEKKAYFIVYKDLKNDLKINAK